MEEKRAKTLEALSTFINSQKALLQRAQTDIARLKQLRHEIASRPAESCDYQSFKNQFASHKLSERTDIVMAVPKELDWSAFASCDPTPFKALEASTRLEHKQRKEPSTTQTTPLSPLQRLVMDARASIIEPVLNAYPPLSSDEEEDPPDPEELRRIREREKIRELKRRKVHGGSGLYGLSGLGLRKVDTEAVFVREDQEDESAEVDIGFESVAVGTSGAAASSARDFKGVVNTPPTSVASPPPATAWVEEKPISTINQPNRARRPPRKAEPTSQHPQASSSKKVIDPTADAEPKLNKKGKPRPDTYKQAWSVEEQHLLERLLEEIPEGAKNRWAQISKAMNGKRTPRQVASRVQKYYEKLKRYGLEVGGSSKSEQ
ncbi:hypothetical protein BC835DRAFT_1411335 [Cytidiella melzeri]|nr:hypothetical protein BC835DRAFT_1411335 [Cytidiella melzeri]